ncbi:MAG: hypothetical protein J6Y28_09600 [Acholeplasmatales bacterium]|nr:hypothetical protein [Methanobrevibacter sp.]MBP5446412.1 hypothetical protein [Acholeplasmatales bacterium]
MNRYKLTIDSLITIDDSGMPAAPTIRQLIDKDVRTLYNRDKSKDKSMYIKECIVIYYLGDPKSPAKQTGFSDVECLKMAIEQADLPKNYVPDTLVLKLIRRYYEENITEAGRVVENILKGLHNINLSIDVINSKLTERLNTGITDDKLAETLNLIGVVNAQSKELPSMLKRLNEAKENLMYEKETELSRGGNVILSSMDADNSIE